MTRGVTIQHPHFHFTPDEHGPMAPGFLETGVALEFLEPAPINSYWHVRLPDTREGFVHSDLVRVIDDAGGGGDGGSPAFSSADEVEAWTATRAGMPFVTWFNQVHAGNRRIANSAQAAAGFRALCNNLPLVFGRPASLEQLLCLVSVAVGETGGSLTPRPELVGRDDLGAPGIAYAFDDIPQIPKASYNKRPNRTAFELFNDPVFMDQFAALPLAGMLRNTPDQRWAGDAYPLDVAPTSTDPAVSGVILECDFYKFRGRGFIQTTWRSNYVRLIQFVQAANSQDSVIQKYQQAWAGLDPEVIATTSTNAQWNELFEQTGFLVACAAILMHSQDHGNYLNVSSDRAVLAAETAIPGSAFHFGLRVNGGQGYARDLRDRVLQMRDLLA